MVKNEMKDPYEEYLEAGVMPGNLERRLKMFNRGRWKEIKAHLTMPSEITYEDDWVAGLDDCEEAFREYLKEVGVRAEFDDKVKGILVYIPDE